LPKNKAKKGKIRPTQAKRRPTKVEKGLFLEKRANFFSATAKL
jgi:hypothetical protein